MNHFKNLSLKLRRNVRSYIYRLGHLFHGMENQIVREETITDADYANDLALLANTPAQS